MPFPVPDCPNETVTHPTLLTAVRVQPLLPVMATWPLPPAAGKVALVGLIEKKHWACADPQAHTESRRTRRNGDTVDRNLEQPAKLFRVANSQHNGCGMCLIVLLLLAAGAEDLYRRGLEL